jgi:phenylalanine-4-hydroxylase
MISAREFLYCLSMRVFCCGQFIRHPSSLEFTVEPDVVHEYVGHVPLLADPTLAVRIIILSKYRKESEGCRSGLLRRRLIS